jgi:hypothetical protein
MRAIRDRLILACIVFHLAVAAVAAAPFPAFTLGKGDFYFSFDGKPGFVFLRNVAGYEQGHYDTVLDWMASGGSRIARIQLDSLGMGYTASGAVDESWAARWERVFDKAAADGIFVLPVFSGWFDWNSGEGYSTWKSNPLNSANGGPVKSPVELFKKGSFAQTAILQWMTALVKRWQGRKNIAAWEIFSEVNLASGGTEAEGIAFANLAASLIRDADPSRRPVTASLADDGRWQVFYRDANVDFIDIHPYPPDSRLDRLMLAGVRQYLSVYKKPVLSGESDLFDPWLKKPDADKALISARHAIWAGIVSGAMNGRAFYWLDSFAIYFEDLGYAFMKKFADADLSASLFVRAVDFSGFKPLASATSSAIWGAAVGSETMVIGWYRDAGYEAPDWIMKPLAGQSVSITVPGNAKNWKIDFIDTKTGTVIVASGALARKGESIVVSLPDFKNDIAFKMYKAD